MMKSITFISILMVLLVLFTNRVTSNSLNIDITKDEMIKLLETLNGGEDSSVPDFLFFTQDRQQTYIQTQGPPRTDKPPPPGGHQKPRPPTRSKAENTLADALNRLQKGGDVRVIEKWASVLDIVLYTDLTPQAQECSIDRITSNVDSAVKTCANKATSGGATGSTTRRARQKQQKRTERRRDEMTKERRLLRDEKRRDEKKRNARIFQEIQEEVKNVLKEDYGMYENGGDIQQYSKDEKAVVIFNEREGNIKDNLIDRYQRGLVRDTNKNIRQHSPQLRPRSLVQNLDLKRMRRSLSYTYSNIGKCYAEGSEGSTEDTVLLCQTCYNTVDFGESVVPQYANSVECSETENKCISGDGKCTQKVIYYSFKKLVDATENSWESYQQPLNVSCECECIADSMTHTYMIGDSN